MFVVLSLLQVFKVLVRKTPDESWVVFRRYTDFSRLNDKVCFIAFSVHMFGNALLCGKYRRSKISGLSETLFCDHLSMFADTVCDYQPIAFSMPPFVFECTVEMIRATQRSLLFPKSHQA